MAIFQASGAVVSEVNGKLGNLVFYRGRGGPVIRAWVNPVNTITPERTAVRDQFAALMSLFDTLTQEMYNDWNRSASELRLLNRLGAQYTPSGVQHFMTTNMNLATIGQSPILIPPVITSINQLKEWNVVTLDPTHMLLDGKGWNDAINLGPEDYQVVSSTLNVAAHTKTKTNRYRIAVVRGPGQPLLHDYLTEWLTIWPTFNPVPGKRIFFKSRIINGITGQATSDFYTSGLVM